MFRNVVVKSVSSCGVYCVPCSVHGTTIKEKFKKILILCKFHAGLGNIGSKEMNGL